MIFQSGVVGLNPVGYEIPSEPMFLNQIFLSDMHRPDLSQILFKSIHPSIHQSKLRDWNSKGSHPALTDSYFPYFVFTCSKHSYLYFFSYKLLFSHRSYFYDITYAHMNAFETSAFEAQTLWIQQSLTEVALQYYPVWLILFSYFKPFIYNSMLQLQSWESIELLFVTSRHFEVARKLYYYIHSCDKIWAAT